MSRYCRAGKHRSVAASVILHYILKAEGWTCPDVQPHRLAWMKGDPARESERGRRRGGNSPPQPWRKKRYVPIVSS